VAHCRERGTSYACQLCELCHHVPDWQTSRFIHPMVPLEIGDGIVGRIPFKQTLTGALPDIRHFVGMRAEQEEESLHGILNPDAVPYREQVEQEAGNRGDRERG
jgi:hypothetical protein